ncbi:MAG: type II secretion system protein [Tepidisphaeraceae bacterium]
MTTRLAIPTGPRRAGCDARVRPLRRDVGFTLIEILIVVVILGILASVVIPQFSNASHEARENTLKDELRYLRTQITVFRAQHRDLSPGYPGGSPSATPTEAAFLDHMTKYSNEDCSTSATPAATHPFGPYLSKMPKNPMTEKGAVKISSANPLVVDDPDHYGWVYNPQTVEIIANIAGNDASGTPYVDY